jgi:uncharacterized protein YwqG
MLAATGATGATGAVGALQFGCAPKAHVPGRRQSSLRIRLAGPAGQAESRVGGQAFLPPTVAYPHTRGGVPLSLLAQVNFAEVPPLPGFPSDGLLAFFILDQARVAPPENELLYGQDYDHPLDQNGFRVLYLRPEQLATSRLQENSSRGERLSPLAKPDRPLRMRFTRQEEDVSCNDYRYPQSLSVECPLERLGNGHKLGGYPYFTQTDPRVETQYQRYELLLQLDSDQDMMWGDAGVGNFFIRPEDMARRDFSRVLYHWDCS